MGSTSTTTRSDASSIGVPAPRRPTSTTTAAASTWHSPVASRTPAPRQSACAALGGIGTDQHGNATSALRVGHPLVGIMALDAARVVRPGLASEAVANGQDATGQVGLDEHRAFDRPGDKKRRGRDPWERPGPNRRR